MTEADFWNRAARKYAKSPISNMPAYEQTLQHVRQYLRPEQTALEVGCGTGSTALLLAPSVARYTGTDLSSEMIKIANEKLAVEAISGLDFAVTTATLDTIEPASVDVVLAFNLYHLVPDLDAALKSAYRTLKPGGLFITKTPCIASKWYFRPLVSVMQLFNKAPFVLFLSVGEYDTAIRNAGFTIVEATFYGSGQTNRFTVAKKP